MTDAEHWHAVVIAGLGTEQIVAAPTMPIPTATEAKNLALTRIKSAIDKMSGEERTRLEARHAKMSADLADVDEGFMMVMPSSIVAVYDCEGADPQGCANMCQLFTTEMLRFDEGNDCDCPVHQARRGSAPSGGEPMTGMYL